MNPIIGLVENIAIPSLPPRIPRAWNSRALPQDASDLGVIRRTRSILTQIHGLKRSRSPSPDSRDLGGSRSPYASMEGALAAIRFAAKPAGLPRTCGGFQHALIEIARDVCGVRAADHAETNPGGSELVVTPLACSLVGRPAASLLRPQRLHAIFGSRPATEVPMQLRAQSGVAQSLRSRGLYFTGWDETGACAPRTDLTSLLHRHAFQPERSALRARSIVDLSLRPGGYQTSLTA